MTKRRNPGSRVDAWIDGIPSQPPEELVGALEQALTKLQLWSRLRLGEQVHAGLAHQILHDVRIRFPLLCGDSDDAPSLDLAALAKQGTSDLQQLREAGRFVITEFLRAATPLSAHDPVTTLESFILHHDGNGNGDGRAGGSDGAVQGERRHLRERRLRPPGA